MIRLDLDIKALDDVFGEMTVYVAPPGVHREEPPGFFVRGYFAKDEKGRTLWYSIYGKPWTSWAKQIQRWCCEGKIGSLRLVEQALPFEPGRPTNYALIATDKAMIASIRVGILPVENVTYRGLNLLRNDLPVGLILPEAERL